MKITLWRHLCNFINLYENGQTINRQDIILHLDRMGVLGRYDTDKIWVRSVDVYRRYLTKAGYLEDTDKKGVYKKVSYYPIFDKSMRQTRREAYQYGS